ncbi:MAG: ATP-binding cassette domain-containing protein [bacterium]
MIEVTGLSKKFGDVRAVDDLTFQVKKGEILGFLGPNAAGKTTTMRMITGFIPASSGTVSVAGFDVFHNPLEVKRRIGYLPENPPLYQDMRVEDYLRFVAAIKGVKRRSVDVEIYRVAEKSAITLILDSFIASLSKGFKQRVGLAQALIGDPPVLIFDEPTIGLDPRQIIEVRELIKNLAHEHTVILSTHILPEVSMTCDRVVIINEGRLVAVDTPENLTARLKGSESIRLEIEGPSDEIMRVLQAIPKIRSVGCSATRKHEISEYIIETDLGADIRRDLAATIVKNGWGLLEMKTEKLSLEDIFLKLTTSEERMN